MKTQLKIKTCPTCGSSGIKKMKKDWKGESQGKTYTVPSLSFYECPDCGERVYDRDAMHRIEEKSPALGKAHRKKAA
jgi:YgiT-type zinc finger domain-containing protein